MSFSVAENVQKGQKPMESPGHLDAIAGIPMQADMHFSATLPRE